MTWYPEVRWYGTGKVNYRTGQTSVRHEPVYGGWREIGVWLADWLGFSCTRCYGGQGCGRCDRILTWRIGSDSKTECEGGRRNSVKRDMGLMEHGNGGNSRGIG